MSDLIRSTFPSAHRTEFGRSLIGPGGRFEVVEDDVRGERMAVFRDRRRAVLDLLDDATRAFPDRPYLIDEDRRITYRAHAGAVRALAVRLVEEFGVRPGDRVGIHAANGLEWVLAFWAACAAGGIPTLMNSFWSDPELAHGLAVAGPRVVLADARRADQSARVTPATAVLPLVDDLFRDHSDSAVRKDRRIGVIMDAPDREDDVAVVMFTSGTTGRPKAVAHSHRAVVGTIQGNRFNTVLRAGVLPTAPPPPARVLVSPPLFHLSALYGAVLMFLASGGALVFRPGRFDEERTLGAIASERVSVWISVGSAAPRVAAHPARHAYDLSSLQSVVVGGAPLSPALKQQLCEAFPTAAGGLRMGYTSSEGGSIVASIGGPDFAAHPLSTGPIQDGVQVQVRDDAGRVLPPGEDGRIWVRSACTMVGYWNDPDATAAVFDEHRWLDLGDVGTIQDGLLHIDSRARDLILVSAENVYPSEVENRLEEHPDVVESCVLGVDDPVTGQGVAAVVVLGAPVSEEDLATWCRGGLPPFKVPTVWDLRQTPLPRNAAGKIVRDAVRTAPVVS